MPNVTFHNDQLCDQFLLKDLFEDMLAAGDRLPFRIAFMGANGSFVTGIVREGKSTLEVEFNSICGEGLTLPIDMMIACASDEADLVQLRRARAGSIAASNDATELSSHERRHAQLVMGRELVARREAERRANKAIKLPRPKTKGD